MPQFCRLTCIPVLALCTSCGPLKDAARDLLDNRTARERYQAALESAGLAQTALALDWTSAAERALRNAPLVSSPHAEQGFMHPSEPAALAFRVNLKRGQQISFDLQLIGDTTALVFVEAWQIERDSAVSFRRVAEADSGRRLLTFTPRRDGEFVVRAQPELLRGGRFSVSVRVLPTLAFPVQNGRESDIGSDFGDPRDGGARAHHGIDIFAPRGTPVLAAAAGTINRVETTQVGGNVVWQRDTLGNRLYYAHLDRQNVQQGARVNIGDTIGFIGNTGNARSTPPHLHFGVYSRGPVNPFWFVHTPATPIPPLTADSAALGSWVRVAGSAAILRSSPDARADSLLQLPVRTAVRVVSVVGGWYRVRLPDGSTGYLAARLTETARAALESTRLTEEQSILARPSAVAPTSDVVAQLSKGSSIEILGRFGEFLLVRGRGVSGWMLEATH